MHYNVNDLNMITYKYGISDRSLESTKTFVVPLKGTESDQKIRVKSLSSIYKPLQGLPITLKSF